MVARALPQREGMALKMFTFSDFCDAARPKPPPLWLVTDGEAVVGPVNTNLLLRGVTHRRIPEECLVRGVGWSRWRALDKIREIARLRREQEREGSVWVPKATWRETFAVRSPESARLEYLMGMATDPGEVLLFALNEAVSTTSASVGVVHRRRPPHVGMVTSCARGPGASTLLGHVVSTEDAALDAACAGRVVIEAPGASRASGRTAERLGTVPASGGIAMIPLYAVGMLYAMIEVGRPDHPFRQSDIATFARIANATIERLEVIRN